MGGGIFFPASSIASAQSDATVASSASGSWTPPQFSKPAVTIITVPAAASVTTGQPFSPAIDYIFDAVFKITHRRIQVKTQHPVLTGANISDHRFVKPSRVNLEIGMSDAMSSFTQGVWVGSSTKSISAYQILKGLMDSGTLVTLTTRLDTYYNMLIEDMSAPDDNKTSHGLRAYIVLEEVIAGSISSLATSSARPQTTGSSVGGTVQSTPPNPSQVEQNVIPSSLYPNTPTFSQVPGAGSVSSNSLSQVPTE